MFSLGLIPSLLLTGICVRIPMMNSVNVSEIRLMKNQEQVEIQLLNGKKHTPFINQIRAFKVNQDKIVLVFHKEN